MKYLCYISIIVLSCFTFAHPGDHFVPRQAGTLIDDGDIINQKVYQFPFQSYEQFMQKQLEEGMNKQQITALLTEDKFYQYKANNVVRASQITYRSAATNIAGFMFYPVKGLQKSLPIVIYNHDGYLRNANITFLELIELYRLSEQGYVVLASYFRGNGPSEGRADFTLGDVTDAYNLKRVAQKNIPQANINKVGIWGIGRGAITAYHMVFHNDTFDAAVMLAAPTDFSESHQLTHLDKHVFPYAIRHYKKDPQAAISRVSVHNKVQLLNRKLPILLMHGAQDNEVLVADTLNMATALNSQSQTYRLAIFEQTNHQFDNQRTKVRQEIDYWFNKYLKQKL